MDVILDAVQVNSLSGLNPKQ